MRRLGDRAGSFTETRPVFDVVSGCPLIRHGPPATDVARHTRAPTIGAPVGVTTRPRRRAVVLYPTVRLRDSAVTTRRLP